MAPMRITGVGAATPLGRALPEICERLAATPPLPQREGDALCLRVPDELTADTVTAKRMRRAGRYPKMAALAAMDALRDARPAAHAQRTALIVATGLGPHTRTFRFLDGILDCGDHAALPTDFSHSVHGVAASYIAEILDIRDRVCTVTDFERAFDNAVQLAQCWLAAGDCDRALVGAVEELGPVLLQVAPRMAGGTRFVLGEGSAFFVMERSGQGPQIDATNGLEIGGGDDDMHAPSDASAYFGRSSTGRAMDLLREVLRARSLTRSK